MMNISTAIINDTRTDGTGILTFDIRNISIQKKSLKSPIPVYYIDDIVVNDQAVQVDYTLDDVWLDGCIDLLAIKAFMIDEGLNGYCYDVSDHCGNHIQDSGTFEADIYFTENLSFIVKAYLEAKKIGQYHVN